MTVKKTVALLLVFAMLFALSACTKQPDPVPGPAPGPGTDPAPAKDPLSEPITLSLDAANLPVIDGALACLPYYEETVALITGLPIDEARTRVLANNTPASFRELAEGKADLGFLLHASQDQIDYAKDRGVTYAYAPYAKDAFVFFVNKNNPVDSVTMAQLKDIYAGRITNWKQVGGNDEPIIAYQRNEGSGSQTGLYQYVISPDEVMDPPTEIRIGDMGGIIDAVASYENAAGALGYSYLYFVTNQHYDEDIKLLKVDGFAPDEENIRSDKYPMVTEYCLVTREGEATEGTFLRQIIDWCLSDQGQALAKRLSYIPVTENAGTFVAPSLPEMIVTPLHGVTYAVNGNHLTETTVDYKNGDHCEGSYTQISGLKDTDIEEKINRAIFNAFFEELESDDAPRYRGIGIRLAKYNGQKPERYGGGYLSGSFENLISVVVSGSRTYDQVDSEWFSWSHSRGLTFDLRTGDLLKITDLFDDPAEGLKYLNGKVQTAINAMDTESELDDYWYWGDANAPFHLAGSFPGLTEDQNFALTDNGSIVLFFDEKTPWVKLDQFSTATLLIETLDGISLTKFRKDTPIYTDETPTKRLLAHPYPTAETKTVWDWEDEFLGSRNNSFGVDLTYYASMPEAQIAYLPITDEDKEAFRAEVTEAYERIVAETPDYDIQVSANLNGYVTRVADYTNVYNGRNYYTSAWKDNNWISQIESMNGGRYYVFKGDASEPMEIEQIFREGADIPALLKKAAWAELEAAGEEYVKYARLTGWFDDLLDDLYARHLDFAIGSDELSVYPESMEYSTLFELVKQYGGEYLEQAWIYTGALQSLRYDSIGIENLTIFD